MCVCVCTVCVSAVFTVGKEKVSVCVWRGVHVLKTVYMKGFTFNII